MEINPKDVVARFNIFNDNKDRGFKQYLSFNGHAIELVEDKSRQTNLKSISFCIEQMLKNGKFDKLTSKEVNSIKEGLKTIKKRISENQGIITRLFGQAVLEKADAQIATLDKLEHQKQLHDSYSAYPHLVKDANSSPEQNYVIYGGDERPILQLRFPSGKYDLPIDIEKDIPTQINTLTSNDVVFKAIQLKNPSLIVKNENEARDNLSQKPSKSFVIFKTGEDHPEYKIMFKLPNQELSIITLQNNEKLLNKINLLNSKAGATEMLKLSRHYAENDQGKANLALGDFLVTPKNEMPDKYNLILKLPNGQFAQPEIPKEPKALFRAIEFHLTQKQLLDHLRNDPTFKGSFNDEKEALKQLSEGRAGDYCVCKLPNQRKLQFIRKLPSGGYHMESLPRNQSLYQGIQTLLNKIKY